MAASDPCAGFVTPPASTDGTVHEEEGRGDDGVSPTSRPSQTGVKVNIFPHTDIRLAAGYSLRLETEVRGTTNTDVEWVLTGSGCSGSGCGSITGGAYLAPSVVPNPPIVRLSATSKTDSRSSDSIRVCIVQQAPQFKILSAAASIRAASLTTGQQESAKSGPSQNKYGPMDVVSETNGMDFRPYLAIVLPRIKANWYSRIPDVAREPVLKKGIVVVAFKVMRDGTVSEVRYTQQSGDDALDSAAYDGVARSSPLPALPRDFGCKFVALRIHFLYNTAPRESVSDHENAGAIPCVTTNVRFGGEMRITLSPDSSHVAAGDRQQFTATVIGVDNPAIVWNVAGPGCAGVACGEITADGIYRAPSDIPNPATVTITATLKGVPDENVSVAVIIVPVTGSH